MATVNFQCGHCHKLMAVGQEHLGQQVRCPHCQQVVLAPAQPPPATPPPPPVSHTIEMPTIEVPNLDDQDSIFTPPEAALDDLFGEAPVPHIEVPTEPAFPPVFPRLALEEPTVPSESAPASGPIPLPPLDAVPALEPVPQFPPTELLSTEQFSAPPATESLPPTQEAAAPSVEDEEPLVAIKPPRPRASRGNPWVIPLIIAPLAFYSLMATIYILDTRFLHMFTPPPPPHPLEILPDLDGDHAGSAKRGKQTSLKFKVADPDEPLAPQLRVGLGKTLAVGDLEVTPQKVERRRHTWTIEGFNDQPFAEDALSLTLRLRNRSTDVTFTPMDRYFARKWPTGDNRGRPYTHLEMGDRKYYGGALTWVPLEKRNSGHIEYLKGQNVNEELKPGQEMTTFFCTDPDKHVVKALDSYRGKLLWRVHLRRGLVKWTTANGVDRDDPATTVVGVEFTEADVKKASD